MAINTQNLGPVSRTKGGTISLNIDDLVRVMSQSASELHKSGAQVLREAGSDLVSQLKRMTPIAPRLTKLLWFTNHQGVTTSRAKKEASRPHGRGFARFTWQAAGEQAKIKKMKTDGYVAGTKEAAFGSLVSAGDQFTLTLTNNTNYVHILDRKYRIVDGAVHNTTYKLLQRLTREVDKQLKKAITSTGGRVL